MTTDQLLQEHLAKIKQIEFMLLKQTQSNILLHEKLIQAEVEKNKAQNKLLMYIAFAGTLSLVLNLFKPKIKIVRYSEMQKLSDRK